MVKYTVKYYIKDNLYYLGDVNYNNTSPYVPQIGSEVHIAGYTLKVVRVLAHLEENRYTVYVTQ